MAPPAVEVVTIFQTIPALSHLRSCAQLPPGPKLLTGIQLDLRPATIEAAGRVAASPTLNPGTTLDPTLVFLVPDNIGSFFSASINRFHLRTCQRLPPGYDVI